MEIDRTWLWIAFHVVVVIALALDLGVFHRRAHAVGAREAAIWSAVWIALGLTFGGVVFHYVGPQAGTEYVTAYLIEKALSVDNLFVFVLVFAYFQVPAESQHRVLYWGILGAIVMRGALIAGGIALVNAFHGVLYLFGVILVWSGIKMLRADEDGVEPEKNPILRLVRQWFPITPENRGSAIWVREQTPQGKLRTLFTPLFVVLVFVELSDLLFAVDSIPAVFAVTSDGMVAYTSNIFAILGLRSLYFLLAVAVSKLRFLKIGLSAILILIGAKMLAHDFIEISPVVSLSLVLGLLVLSTAASLLLPAPKEPELSEGSPEEAGDLRVDEGRLLEVREVSSVRDPD